MKSDSETNSETVSGRIQRVVRQVTFRSTEKEKFKRWFKREQKKGLSCMRFTVNPNIKADDIDEEKIYGELNRMNKAKRVEDVEMF